ncbi:MAG TPA: hypothetical protein ENH82_13775 [bacterium]|nr:hypothetical protein [bacterium]
MTDTMKYTLSYLIKAYLIKGCSIPLELPISANSEEEAIEIARKHLSEFESRILRFTPILSCQSVETQHNLLPYYSHNEEMNYYDRREGQRRIIKCDILAHAGHRRKGVPWVLLSDNRRSGKDRRES